ncbi:MAG: glycosyltransferase family 2 protein [Bacteroidales bacterium]|nr:glycosyltransferase family 2 protein [Bacteroidales bacterium]
MEEKQGQYRLKPLVSIVTVTYDHMDVTADMLRSLEKLTYPATEVIVVDNASPNEDPQVLKDQFPAVSLIKNKENVGFAGANNIGIQKANGKYVLLLNNDTEVEPEFLEPLVNKLEHNPDIGAVSPKIKFYHMPNRLQYAGLTHIHPYTIRSRGIGFNKVDKGQYEEDRLTAYAHGACMMVRVEVAKKLGLMSNAFFLYYEELDWGFRIRQAGYKIYYVHNSIIYHKESVSTGKLSPLKTYYLNRSRLLYMRRNVNGFQLFVSVLFQLFLSFPKNTMVYLFQRRIDLLKAYWHALGWHIKNIGNSEIHHSPAFDEPLEFKRI